MRHILTLAETPLQGKIMNPEPLDILAIERQARALQAQAMAHLFRALFRAIARRLPGRAHQAA